MRNNTSLICSDFDSLEKLESTHQCLARGLVEQAEALVADLKRSVSLNMKRNLRVINNMENGIAYWKTIQGKVEAENKVLSDILMSLKNSLSETYPIWDKEISRIPFSDEISEIIQSEACLQKLGRKDDALDLCRKVIYAYEHSFLDCRFNCRWYGLLLTNYSQTARDISLSKKALSFIISSGSLDGTDRILSNLAVQEYRLHKNKTIAASVLNRSAVMASFFYRDKFIIDSINNYIKKYYV